jgi:hypothetical protein
MPSPLDGCRWQWVTGVVVRAVARVVAMVVVRVRVVVVVVAVMVMVAAIDHDIHFSQCLLDWMGVSGGG